MLRSLAVSVARRLPTGFKGWVHTHPALSRFARKAFADIVSVDGGVVEIASGPMAGLKLVVSEHVSHAHISGSYELETQQAIDGLIQPSFTCYDLGASIGYLSLLMARKTKQVYAFEPAPHAAAEFRRHIAANQFENIDIITTPVSDSAHTVEFGLTDNAYGSRIVESGVECESLKLTTTTLDDFASTNPAPDFIKMDVEGEEGRVLQGARSVLRDAQPLICCELHSEEAAREVQSILLEYGYKITTLDGAEFKITGPIIPGDLQVIAVPKNYSPTNGRIA